MSYINIVLNIIPTLYEGCIVSVHRMVSYSGVYCTNVSDVPRSLQSGVSTIQTVVLTADVFQLFIKNS